MRYAVIMAGGRGQRLWPLSREKRPKQVLKLIGGKTLLRVCFERLEGVFDPDRVLVLTNAAYVDVVRAEVPEVPPENVIGEPQVRDTSGAIGLAASVLAAMDHDASMAVVTADQVIEPAETLRSALCDGLDFVEENPSELLVFGIRPTFPSTQLGYVQLASLELKAKGGKVFRVEKFREKPDEKTAAEYISAGNFMWNSGMFVWKAATILDKLKKFVPETAGPLGKITAAWNTPARHEAVEEHFARLPKISIDYAVMEKAEKAAAIKLDCRWLDLGSFEALGDVAGRDKKGNVVAAGASTLLDCRDNIVVTEDNGHLMAAIGLKDMVFVHSPDATLVCPADQAHRLKELLERIRLEGGGRYL